MSQTRASSPRADRQGREETPQDHPEEVQVRRSDGSGRDAERTKEKILLAARKEFAAKGFDGARVDLIAQQAHISKRMLYYYYTNKAGLFRAVLEQQVALRYPDSEYAPDDLGERLTLWFKNAFNDPEWVHFLIWEGLRIKRGRVEATEGRLKNFQLRVEKVRHDQEAGTLSAELDPSFLALAFSAMITFPFAFPQLTYFITGLFPTEKVFQKKQEAFLQAFAKALQRADDPCDIVNQPDSPTALASTVASIDGFLPNDPDSLTS